MRHIPNRINYYYVKSKVKVFVSICFLLCTLGCAGATKITIRPESNFTRTSSITVVPFNKDSQNVQGRLESFLMTNGFNVISFSVASSAIEYEETVEESSGKTETEGSIGALTKVKSNFALNYSYSTRSDFPAGRVFSNFVATIVELNTGKVVISADFSQGSLSGKTIDSVLREFIRKLAEKTK